MTKEVLTLLIPIIAIIMGCGIPLLHLFLDYRRRKELFELYHQERQAAIEKGVELPPLPESFFTESWSDKNAKPSSTHGRLLVGLVWFLAGAGSLVALYAHKPDSALYALIPIGIGLAYLIYYFVVGKKEAETLEAERKTKAAVTNRPMV